MRHFQRTIALVVVFSLALLLTMGGLGVAAASSGDSAEPVAVSLEPANQTVEPGEEASYDIVVEGATGGIGAYETTVELGNTSAATITGFDHQHDPMFDNTAVYGDRVEISAAMGDNVIGGDEEIVLGAVTVTGDSEGESDVAFAGGADGVDLADESDQVYDSTSAANGTLSVDMPTVDVRLAPTEQTVSAGSTTSYDLVVEGATGGISAYVMRIELGNSSVATVEGFEYTHDPQFDNTDVTESQVNLSVAMGDNAIAPGEEVVLGTLTLSGETPGSTGIAFDDGTVEVAANNEGVNAYGTGTVTDGSLEVTEMINPATVELVPLDSERLGEMELGVVVTGADSGISAYELEMTSSSSGVAFVDYGLTAEGSNGPLDNSEISADGMSLLLSAALLDAVHAPAEETQIATVTVEVSDLGTHGIEFGDMELQDTDSNTYDVTGEGLTLSVTLPPVTGDDPPQDLDGDGRFEDVDGNGNFNIFDVQAFFLNSNNPVVKNNAWAFNFDGIKPPAVDIFDVQVLFELL